MLAARDFDYAGQLPVGACDFVPSIPEEDRGITLLREAWRELEPVARAMAEVVPPDRRAVAAGTSKGGVLLYIELGARAPERLLDLLPDAPARAVARWVGAEGPRQALVGACATAMQNVIRACEWIVDGAADMAVAGSTEATLTPIYLQSFLKLGALSPKGCFPFDERRCGFVAGEGAGLFVLASEEAAARAGLEPLAWITSFATAAEAWHQTAIRTDGRQVEGLVKILLRKAELAPEEIGLIGLHGTGTALNDAAEAAALRLIYANSKMPPVFSTKGAIGHLMGGTGGVELAAVVECLRAQIAPATVGYASPAEDCRGLEILTAAQPQTMSRALKWNMGFGGHLAGCVVERA